MMPSPRPRADVMVSPKWDWLHEASTLQFYHIAWPFGLEGSRSHVSAASVLVRLYFMPFLVSCVMLLHVNDGFAPEAATRRRHQMEVRQWYTSFLSRQLEW